MSILSNITIIIAIYGAIISTYSLYLNRKDKIATIRVRLKENHIIAGELHGPPFIQLEALNFGLLDITFNHAFITTKNKKSKFYPEHKHIHFPYDLAKGKSLQIVCNPENISIKFHKDGFSSSIKIIGIFTDAIGNEYKSRPIKFDVTKWFNLYQEKQKLLLLSDV